MTIENLKAIVNDCNTITEAVYSIREKMRRGAGKVIFDMGQSPNVKELLCRIELATQDILCPLAGELDALGEYVPGE